MTLGLKHTGLKHTESTPGTNPTAVGGPETPILGLHHVTAIAGDAQANLDFYAGLLGLRLVKKTVNFDDPGTYHLYYGDAAGSPGSILTFFPWKGARRGRDGAGTTSATSFAVPAARLDFWRSRLSEADVPFQDGERFGDSILQFRDHEGLGLELVAVDPAPAGFQPWNTGDIPASAAILGFHGVTLRLRDVGPSRTLLESVMGFRMVGEENGRLRFESGDGGSSTYVDLLEDPQAPRALGGAGTVHHVAFRNADDGSQAEWRQHLMQEMVLPTDVKDRQYFHSIYYREPGGVLFELATDPPGFTFDESQDALGQDLKLPPWLETARDRIEAALPSLGEPKTWASKENAS